MMKRVFSLLLVLALVFSLQACGDDSDGSKHTHKWEPATCQAPKTCSSCGDTKGEVGDHNWITVVGSGQRVCTVCGIPEGSQEIPMPGTQGAVDATTGATSGTNTEPTESKKTIAIIAKGETHAFWQAVKAGAQAAGSEYGYNIIFRGPSSEMETEIPAQIQMVEDALNQDVAGIGLATIGNGFAEVMARAYNWGVPVVQFDSGIRADDLSVLNDVRKNPTVASVTIDNKIAGAVAAQNLYNYLKSQGVLKNGYKIGVIQHDQTQTGIARAAGFTEKIQELAWVDGISLSINLQDEYTYGRYTQGLRTLYNWGAQAIFMGNEGVVNEVFQECRDNGAKYKNIVFTGFDAGTNQYNWIKDQGRNYPLLIGSVAQDSYMLGYNTVKQIVAAIEGGRVADVGIAGCWYNAQNIDELVNMNIVYMG